MNEPYANCVITFAIAPKVELGVVCVRFTSKLSRLFRWNLKDDTFEPGQFLKAAAYITTISPDGKFFGYWVDDYSQPVVECYCCVAHVPYFTALVYLPTYTNTGRNVEFISDGVIAYSTNRADAVWRDGVECPPDYIAPDSPYQIVSGYPSLAPHNDGLRQGRDAQRNRSFHSERNKLYASDGVAKDARLIREFEKEKFRGIPPPDWVKKW